MVKTGFCFFTAATNRILSRGLNNIRQVSVGPRTNKMNNTVEKRVCCESVNS